MNGIHKMSADKFLYKISDKSFLIDHFGVAENNT